MLDTQDHIDSVPTVERPRVVVAESQIEAELRVAGAVDTDAARTALEESARRMPATALAGLTSFRLKIIV